MVTRERLEATMKKQQVQLAVVAALVLLLGVPARSPAAQAPFPKTAKGVTFWMARAFDQCSPSGMSVTGPGYRGDACLSSNTATDNTLTMNSAKVRITTRGRIKVLAKGFTFGDILRVRLTLRVTRNNLTVKHPPATGQNATFQDQTVDCPGSPDAFTVRPNGAIAASTDLAACLPNSGLAFGNIEVIDASLVNAMTGKEVAKPGLVR
jgi:hypothetical protein